MLTQSAPAIVKAMSGVLPPNAVAALTQALGNCNQPLAHRGAINFSPPEMPEVGPGWFDGNQWNPFDYANLLPFADQANNVDVPGWKPTGGWPSSNYYGDTFNFPMNQDFTINQFMGGPNVYNAGSQYVANMYSSSHVTNNLTTQNINVSTINGQPIVGPAGPPGRDGMNGAPGAPGAPGQVGVLAGGFFGNLKVQRGALPLAFKNPPSISLNDAIRFTTAKISIPTEFTIDSESCTVSVTDSEEVDVITSVNAAMQVPIRNIELAPVGPVVTDVTLVR